MQLEFLLVLVKLVERVKVQANNFYFCISSTPKKFFSNQLPKTDIFLALSNAIPGYFKISLILWGCQSLWRVYLAYDTRILNGMFDQLTAFFVQTVEIAGIP